MAATKKSTRKTMSMVDEDRAFFESAYKNDPKARAAMDAAGIVPGKKASDKAAAKAPTKKASKK